MSKIVEEYSCGGGIASTLFSDVSSDYRVPDGYDVSSRESEPWGLRVTDGEDEYRLLAVKRLLKGDGEEQDIIPLCRIEGQEIQPVSWEDGDILRRHLTKRAGSIPVHPAPLNQAILDGEYEDMLKDDSPTKPYRPNPTPPSQRV